jgi:hypothetical protein
MHFFLAGERVLLQQLAQTITQGALGCTFFFYMRANQSVLS